MIGDRDRIRLTQTIAKERPVAESQHPPGASPSQTIHIDRPEISETFADALARLTYDGATLRMEFIVNRLDDPNPPAPPTGKALTVCRIVMPLPGMIDMINKLQALMAQLQASGVLR